MTSVFAPRPDGAHALVDAAASEPGLSSGEAAPLLAHTLVLGTRAPSKRTSVWRCW